MRLLCVIAMLVSTPAWADWDFSRADWSGLFGTGRGPLPTPTSRIASVFAGVHLGVNALNPQLDLKLWKAYVFTSFTLGAWLVTNRSLGAVPVGVGYSGLLAVNDSAAWYLDLFAFAAPGWDLRGNLDEQFLVAGLGAGARYVHRSGLVLGFKLPLFGSGTRWQAGAATSPLNGDAIARFYLTSLWSLPMLTIGGTLSW